MSHAERCPLCGSAWRNFYSWACGTQQGEQTYQSELCQYISGLVARIAALEAEVQRHREERAAR